MWFCEKKSTNRLTSSFPSDQREDAIWFVVRPSFSISRNMTKNRARDGTFECRCSLLLNSLLFLANSSKTKVFDNRLCRCGAFLTEVPFLSGVRCQHSFLQFIWVGELVFFKQICPHLLSLRALIVTQLVITCRRWSEGYQYKKNSHG